MYVYQRTEPGLWTVGFYRPDDNIWIAESDHETKEAAAERTAWLNGSPAREALDAMVRRIDGIAEVIETPDWRQRR